MGESGLDLHLWQMLVRQVHAVGAESVVRPRWRRLRFELGDQTFATPGVPRDCVHSQREVDRNQPRRHQRPHQCDEAGGIAPWVRHPGCRPNCCALGRRHLGKPIGPVRCDPIGCRSIDHLYAIGRDEAYRLARCIIRQAQHDSVSGIQQLGARIGVLASRWIARDHFQIGAALQSFADLQARGAGFAVDEDGVGHNQNPVHPRRSGEQRKRALRFPEAPQSENASVRCAD